MEGHSKIYFLLLIILMFPLSGISQVKPSSRFAINIGLGTEKVGIPFRKVFDFPMHSSYHLGIERRWFEDIHRSSFQSLDVFIFSNNSAGSGYSFQSSYGIVFPVFKTFYFSPSAGAGIVHLFRPKESFYLENGIYHKYDDRGIVKPDLCLNFKIGYHLNRIGLFASYQTGLQLGYSDDIVVLPRSILTIGLRYEV